MKSLSSYHTSNGITHLCRYHVIFCTKYRRKIFRNGLEASVQDIFAQIANERGFSIEAMDVFPNYVHLIIDCDPLYGIINCVKTLKRQSPQLIKACDPTLNTRLPFIWTRKALIFTVGQEDETAIQDFIAAQPYE